MRPWKFRQKIYQLKLSYRCTKKEEWRNNWRNWRRLWAQFWHQQLLLKIIQGLWSLWASQSSSLTAISCKLWSTAHLSLCWIHLWSVDSYQSLFVSCSRVLIQMSNPGHHHLSVLSTPPWASLQIKSLSPRNSDLYSTLTLKSWATQAWRL